MSFTKKPERSILVITFLFCALFLSPNQVSPQGLKFRVSQTKHFTIHFAEPLTAAELGALKVYLEDAHTEVSQELNAIFGNSNVAGRPIDLPIDLIVFGTTGDFTSLTKLPWWSASCVKGDSIYFQPIRTLKSRGILNEIIRHEVALVFIKRLSGDNEPPVWLAEGLAVHLSGEIERLKSKIDNERPRVSGTDDIDALLLNRGDIDKNRWGYVLAYEEVMEMIENDKGKEILRLLLGGQQKNRKK